ncbi:MAG TPA: hypothetical protein VNW46_19475 [Gemmatimonadaceae bacterium]|nr:hypothetical protein [Gemmatimonadaceae bacterium]
MSHASHFVSIAIAMTVAAALYYAPGSVAARTASIHLASIGNDSAVTSAVTAPPRAGRTVARDAATITVVDNGFDVPQPLVAGRQTLHVRNMAAEPHDIYLGRILPNKSLGDLVSWIEAQRGPAPVVPVTGLTPLAPGAEGDIDVDLTPGRYGLICIFPNARDGKPNFMHGMMREITVVPRAIETRPVDARPVVTLP